MTKTEATRKTAVYVYGIVPADVQPTAGARGVGDPPADVTIVRRGEIAALVSTVETDHPLGKPEDLRAHEQLLDATAEQAPVLPMRFGAVLTDEDAVAEELLAEHHDEFAGALEQLEGHAEYVAKGRYVEDVVLHQLLEQNPQAATLRERIRRQTEDASRPDRIALGEIINNAITRMREQDSQRVAEALDQLALEVSVRPATHELDAFQVACLVETARERELEDAMQQIADQLGNHVEVRLLGPVAPWDFVVTTKPET